MAKLAKPRLVEGPICRQCGGALSIEETKTSEGANVTFTHRDGPVEHRAIPVYKVIRP